MTRVTLSRLPGDRVLVVDGDLERADDCDDPIVLVRNAPNPAALGSYFAVAKDD